MSRHRWEATGQEEGVIARCKKCGCEHRYYTSGYPVRTCTARGMRTIKRKHAYAMPGSTMFATAGECPVKP